MRKVLLGIVALMVAGELLAAATLSRRAGRKVRVSDPALARELITTGATLIADYGAFQLLEADPARVAPLIQAGRAEARDEEDLVLLNTRALDTRSDEAQARTAARAPVETFAGRRLHLVQFAGPVKPEWYAALAGTGAAVVTYIPHNTYLDTTGIDLARLGPQNLQSGASGTLFFDRFESRRTTPIGP